MRANQFVNELMPDDVKTQAPVDSTATDQKATQKVAQRATALKSVAGGNASGGMVAKGMDKVASGSTLPPNLIKAIQDK